ncbi:tail terminator [Streptomyces phage Dubu]|uniref:Tail terminator n=1 Tax=Streptomyces phage Dubu TaxID=2591226 RepID=A0A514DET4_9CAUD|nr:tail terminator [Streptomyces phage Dubu]QDH92116.1 tail terminator [Streptomyces phage Dubu]
MATALRPLQTAIYAKLTASPALMSRVSGVYDEVPEPATFPYVSFGAFTEAPSDAHDRQGLEVLVTIHVWSKAPGFGEAYDVFGAVDAALDRVPLAVSGFTDVSISTAEHQAIKDPDPDVRHINAQYRVWLTRNT